MKRVLFSCKGIWFIEQLNIVKNEVHYCKSSSNSLEEIRTMPSGWWSWDQACWWHDVTTSLPMACYCLQLPTPL